MKPIIKKIIESIILLLISMALWTIFLIPISAQINNQQPLNLLQNGYIFLVFLVLVLAINWYCQKQGYLDWKNLFPNRRVQNWLLFGIVGSIVLHFVVTFIGQVIGQPYIDSNSDATGYYLVIDTMSTVILAPLVEEIVFRRILTTVIFPRNLIISLIITGIVFAALHMPTTLGDWINQLGAAFVLSLIYYKTKRVEASILVHTFMNVFITAIYWWIMYS